jgi:hypothetical protein
VLGNKQQHSTTSQHTSDTTTTLQQHNPTTAQKSRNGYNQHNTYTQLEEKETQQQKSVQ